MDPVGYNGPVFMGEPWGGSLDVYPLKLRLFFRVEMLGFARKKDMRRCFKKWPWFLGDRFLKGSHRRHNFL